METTYNTCYGRADSRTQGQLGGSAGHTRPTLLEASSSRNGMAVAGPWLLHHTCGWTPSSEYSNKGRGDLQPQDAGCERSLVRRGRTGTDRAGQAGHGRTVGDSGSGFSEACKDAGIQNIGTGRLRPSCSGLASSSSGWRRSQHELHRPGVRVSCRDRLRQCPLAAPATDRNGYHSELAINFGQKTNTGKPHPLGRLGQSFQQSLKIATRNSSPAAEKVERLGHASVVTRP